MVKCYIGVERLGSRAELRGCRQPSVLAKALPCEHLRATATPFSGACLVVAGWLARCYVLYRFYLDSDIYVCIYVYIYTYI